MERTPPFLGFTRSDAFTLAAAAPTAVAVEGEATAGTNWPSQTAYGAMPLPYVCELRYARIFVTAVGGAPVAPSGDLTFWLSSDATGNQGVGNVLTTVTWNAGATANFGWASVRLDLPWAAESSVLDTLYVWAFGADAAQLTCRCDVFWEAHELTRTQLGQYRTRYRG